MKTVVTVKTEFRLYVEDSAGVNPAGNRLRKGGSFPLETFVFETKEEAQKAASKLARYLEQNA